MSKKKKRKNHDEGHPDESWLLPYSDLMTLLLALFIVLFASSTVNAQKFQELSKVFNGIFSSGVGVLDYSNPQQEENFQTTKPQEKTQVNKEKTNAEQKAADEEKKKFEQQKIKDHEELAEVQTKINTYIKENNLTGKFATSLTTEGLLLTIRDNVLFGSGNASITGGNIKIAKEVSKLLVMDPPRNILISGHTDNVPIHNSNFESNWELSMMRAYNFMKVILKNEHLEAKNFSVKGYGEYQPIATNATEEGRAKNRRVEVLILPRVKSN